MLIVYTHQEFDMLSERQRLTFSCATLIYLCLCRIYIYIYIELRKDRFCKDFG